MFPHDCPAGSSDCRLERLVTAEGKSDRLGEPATAMASPALRMSNIEQRIKEAFAGVSRPPADPELTKALQAAIRGGRLDGETTASIADTDVAASREAARPQAGRRQRASPAATSARTPDGESIFEFSGEPAGAAMALEEPLGGGYLTALAPPENVEDFFPEMSAGDDALADVPLPDVQADIPVPTPRPADAPVARLAPPASAKPATPAADPRPQPAAQAAVRPKPPAQDPPAKAETPRAAAPQQPTPEARSEPQLPASLMPTRPPASAD